MASTAAARRVDRQGHRPVGRGRGRPALEAGELRSLLFFARRDPATLERAEAALSAEAKRRPGRTAADALPWVDLAQVRVMRGGACRGRRAAGPGRSSAARPAPPPRARATTLPHKPLSAPEPVLRAPCPKSLPLAPEVEGRADERVPDGLGSHSGPVPGACATSPTAPRSAWSISPALTRAEGTAILQDGLGGVHESPV
jgi:hypothetical protein